MNIAVIDPILHRQAYLLVKDIDKNDFAFVALAMHIPESKLLTGDKRLIEGLRARGFESVISPSEIINS